MGVCCEAEATGGRMDTDLLPMRMDNVQDVYRHYELSTIFARTKFAKLNDAVARVAGVEDFLVIDELSQSMGTPLWLSAKDDESEARQLLMHPMF